MTIKEVLARLEKHEAECILRMEMINQRLEQHDQSFAKLERYLVSGFSVMGATIVLTIGFLEFLR